MTFQRLGDKTTLKKNIDAYLALYEDVKNASEFLQHEKVTNPAAATQVKAIISFDPSKKYNVHIDSCDAEDGRMTNQYDSDDFMAESKLNLGKCDGDICYDTFTGEQLNRVPAQIKALMLRALALSKNHHGVAWHDSLLTVYENDR